MKKIIFTTYSFCMLFSHLIMAQSYSGAESVEFDFANNRYLVSNTSTNQIIARAANGTLSVFATLGGSPYGIEIVGDTLYCCTSGNLRGVNLNTGVEIFNQLIANGAFLNGITHDPAGNLYLTGFSNKKVYRFNTATRLFNVFVNNTTTTPNGIIYDAYDGINPRLVLAGWGSPATVKSISLADSSISLLVSNPSLSSIDGIAKGKNGNFYLSCWGNNSIQRYDSTFTNAPTAMVTTGISSPADIYYNQLTDTLAVPFGTNVNFYYFGTLTAQKSLLSSQEINIYPNPSNGLIHISGKVNEKVALKMYEIATGKLIYSQNMVYLNENSFIDLTYFHFSAGLYVIELSSYDGIISRNKLTFE